MKQIILIVAICLMGFLSACSSDIEPRTPTMISSYQLPVAPDPKKGLVFVIRPGDKGSFTSFDVYLNGRDEQTRMGVNNANQYVYFYARPGSYIISSKAENWDDALISVGAGQVLYVKQEARRGIVMARASLHTVSEAVGRQMLRAATRGAVLKDHL